MHLPNPAVESTMPLGASSSAHRNLSPVSGARVSLARGKNRFVRSVLLLFVVGVATLLLGTPTACAQNSTIFGPNVYVFTPSDSVSSINSTLNTLNTNAQFSTNRYAVLFEPGTYTGVEAEVGYYESVAGLGQAPTATTISNGYLTSNQTDSNGNLTTNFWRSIENMSINSLPAGDTSLQWGVSQGAAFRRMSVNGAVELTNTSCGEASGGFIADSQITGQVNACSQQQWYTRNSSIGSFSGNVWNFVFSGVSGAPAQSNPFGTGANANTVLATTPVSREKPFLYLDSSGNYWVFSPALRTNSSGTSWSGGGLGAGTSLPISSFYIATPASTLAAINAALASGQNLILTPGIYQYSGSINVTNANTVVLGLGYANLVPQSGTAAITVADVGGVQIAGLLIDAGPVNSPVLFQVGTAGASRVSHASNPTSINDVFFRIGGAVQGSATESMEIDSDNVILDNIWAWRADHGTGVGWTSNVGINGLVVNGDYVTALGLAVEHYEGAQVQWNGEGGETIFYQSEMPYDVPSQSAWMDGSIDGWASYNVSPAVTTHQAYGVGVYSYFNQGVAIIANSGILAPLANGVKFTDSLSVFLAGSGQINYTLASDSPTADNAGTTADSASYISDVSSWGGTSGNCTAVPTVPGTPMATSTSSTGISLSWNGSTAPTACTVSYNLFRSTASGFTPSSSNMIASSLTSGSYADTGLSPSTTYYYIVEASDGDGTAAASIQGSATTGSGSGSCSAVPSAPTGLTATASSSSAIGLSWTAVTPPANCSISSYSIYRSTTSGFTPSLSNLVASGVTGTSYSNSGLTASTTYYYVVEALDSFGTSAASAQASATTQSGSGSCSAVPSAPTGLTATATSSSAIGLQWSAGTPPANCSISSYSVYRSTTSGFTPSSSNLLASNVTGTSYSNTGLAASTTYYYVVEALDSFGTSAASGQASATTASGVSSGGSMVVGIDSGSTSAVSPFVADEDYNSSTTTYSVTNAITIPSSLTNPAPMAVYQTARQGTITYTIPNLTAGSSYTVRLHFAELYFSTSGSRQFNVAINGTTVLTNFDIVATAGGRYTANIQQFSATANSSGQIVIAFTNGAKDQPMVEGIEIDGSGGSAPAAPTNLTATAASSSQINLSWTGSSGASSYTVYRSTTSGFTPSSSNQIASGVTSTSYSNTGLSASTTYYYLVEAVNSSGSGPSNQASATTSSGSSSSCATLCIDAGSTSAVSPFVADEDFSGGGTYSVTNTITIPSSLTNPAPMAVYQTARQGTVTYTIPNLTAGSSHTVRLHFAELYWNASGKREFNVAINGTTVLTNFDIFATAGGQYTANIQQFSATANSSGQIVISFTNGAVDQPMFEGIEID